PVARESWIRNDGNLDGNLRGDLRLSVALLGLGIDVAKPEDLAALRARGDGQGGGVAGGQGNCAPGALNRLRESDGEGKRALVLARALAAPLHAGHELGDEVLAVGVAHFGPRPAFRVHTLAVKLAAGGLAQGLLERRRLRLALGIDEASVIATAQTRVL